MERASGILMHISSLPSPYGIGDFGKEAYKFVDFLHKGGLKYWQILPIGVTGFGDSPYQSFSAFGGNPYFIDLDELIEEGFLDIASVNSYDLGQDENRVDYGLVYDNKMKLLEIAYLMAKDTLEVELEDFYHKNKTWLRDFSLFMAIKGKFKGQSWLRWEKNYRDVSSSQVLEFEESSKDQIFFWVFIQYYFYKQWDRLKEYTNKKGIKIIGDLPIYVSEDSADVWSKPYLFKLNKNLLPIYVAGCPPDDFSQEGQLWGNPIYDWSKMEELEYGWWKERVGFSLNLFDFIRIDHFIGFERYWEIPYGKESARFGKWVKGPSKKIFDQLKSSLEGLNIIAEDLGYLTEEVKDLIKYTGFPGMKVLQFAFNPHIDSDYLPHNHERNSIVYTGTHDNPTLAHWEKIISKEELNFAKDYLKISEEEGIVWGLIRAAWASHAMLAIVPIQDFLGLGEEGRMNEPSTRENNWQWRISKDRLNESLTNKILELNKLYKR